MQEHRWGAARQSLVHWFRWIHPLRPPRSLGTLAVGVCSYLIGAIVLSAVEPPHNHVPGAVLIWGLAPALVFAPAAVLALRASSPRRVALRAFSTSCVGALLCPAMTWVVSGFTWDNPTVAAEAFAVRGMLSMTIWNLYLSVPLGLFFAALFAAVGWGVATLRARPSFDSTDVAFATIGSLWLVVGIAALLYTSGSVFHRAESAASLQQAACLVAILGVALTALGSLRLLARRLFLRAVRKRRVRGWCIRPLSLHDRELPRWFLLGRTEAVLVYAIDRDGPFRATAIAIARV